MDIAREEWFRKQELLRERQQELAKLVASSKDKDIVSTAHAELELARQDADRALMRYVTQLGKS